MLIPRSVCGIYSSALHAANWAINGQGVNIWTFKFVMSSQNSLPVRKSSKNSFSSKNKSNRNFREYILYCELEVRLKWFATQIVIFLGVPTGSFAAHLESFWGKSKDIFNGAHNYSIPHITLVSFFKVSRRVEPSINYLLNRFPNFRHTKIQPAWQKQSGTRLTTGNIWPQSDSNSTPAPIFSGSSCRKTTQMSWKGSRLISSKTFPTQVCGFFSSSSGRG